MPASEPRIVWLFCKVILWLYSRAGYVRPVKSFSSLAFSDCTESGRQTASGTVPDEELAEQLGHNQMVGGIGVRWNVCSPTVASPGPGR